MTDKEKAKEIRALLKKKFGLTSRDVSVRSRSSIDLEIKTIKALMIKSKIEKESSQFERIFRDHATGEILAGGNTFVFVSIEWKFRKKLASAVEAEIMRTTKTGELENGTVVKLFGKIELAKTNRGEYVVSYKKAHEFLVHDLKSNTNSVLGFIINNAPEVLKKLA